MLNAGKLSGVCELLTSLRRRTYLLTIYGRRLDGQQSGYPQLSPILPPQAPKLPTPPNTPPSSLRISRIFTKTIWVSVTDVCLDRTFVWRMYWVCPPIPPVRSKLTYNVRLRAALECPALFDSLVLVDPIFHPVIPGANFHNEDHFKLLPPAIRRRSKWASR